MSCFSSSQLEQQPKMSWLLREVLLMPRAAVKCGMVMTEGSRGSVAAARALISGCSVTNYSIT